MIDVTYVTFIGISLGNLIAMLVMSVTAYVAVPILWRIGMATLGFISKVSRALSTSHTEDYREIVDDPTHDIDPQRLLTRRPRTSEELRQYLEQKDSLVQTFRTNRSQNKE